VTVFFDIDGTLLDDDDATRAAALALLRQHRAVFDLSDDAFVRRWKDLAATHWRRYERREVTFAEQRRARVIDMFWASEEALSVADADDLFGVYVRHYERNWGLFPNVLPCLDALAGRPLGVISNGDPAQQRKKLERTGLLHRFAAITIAGEVGVAKPDPAIFREACRRIGRPAQACTYVGDQYLTDAHARAHAGLRGVWIDRLGASVESPDDVIDIIHTLADLPRALGQHAHARSRCRPVSSLVDRLEGRCEKWR